AVHPARAAIPDSAESWRHPDRSSTPTAGPLPDDSESSPDRSPVSRKARAPCAANPVGVATRSTATICLRSGRFPALELITESVCSSRYCLPRARVKLRHHTARLPVFLTSPPPTRPPP